MCGVLRGQRVPSPQQISGGSPCSATESSPKTLGRGPCHPTGRLGPKASNSSISVTDGRWHPAGSPNPTEHNRHLWTHPHPCPGRKAQKIQIIFVQCLWLGGSAERPPLGQGGSRKGQGWFPTGSQRGPFSDVSSSSDVPRRVMRMTQPSMLG